MLSVTDSALEILATLVERARASNGETSRGEAVRIVARKDGWRMAMDQPRPEDETFEYEDHTVLILDAGVADALQDSTLDVDDSAEGLRLQLRQ